MAEKHVAIIGGGIIGSSVAYWLSRSAAFTGKALKVTLIEGTSIAAGASGKAGGLLALDWHGATTSSLAELSYKLHESLASEHDGPARWQYRQIDTLSVSADFASPSPQTKPRPLSASDKQRFSWLDPKVLRETSVLGTFKTTAQVHPLHFTQSMATLAEEKGVKVVIASVVGLERNGDGTFVVRTDGASVEGVTDVVLAAGPWTGSLAKKLGVKAGRAAGITGSRAHSVVLKPEDGEILPPQALFTAIKEGRNHSEPEIYNRSDNTAYACGPTDTSALPPTAADVKVVPSSIETIRRQVSTLSPMLAKASVVAEQACYLPVGSRGGDPVIGQLEPGIWVGSGHTCWGITNGPGTGKVLSELILDGKATSADIRQLAP